MLAPRFTWTAGSVLIALAVSCSQSAPLDRAAVAAKRQSQTTTEWPTYGNDPGGMRYSPLDEITPANVQHLEVAWTYRHGDISNGEGPFNETSAFEATPILMDGRLIFPTPFNRVIALDPETGKELWAYDPKIDKSGNFANQLICRGVAYWRDPNPGKGAACAARVFMGTNDGRLIAIDAATGQPCADFAENGQINLNTGPGDQLWYGEYQVTSPPVVTRNVVIVGSAVGDNQRTDAPSGVVRAYDARTGALLWAWDLAPPVVLESFPRDKDSGYLLGTANVWAPMSVDEERGLVFLPTGNPAPDYYRGDGRESMDFYGSSTVALHVETGEIAWHFQTVHHDLWDFDVPALPALATIVRNGEQIPVVIQPTKMGMLFILNRDTGEPVFGVEERPVSTDGAPGETISPTQPFPLKPPPLIRQEMELDDAFGFTPWDRGKCRDRIAALKFDGIYTPPSLQGSLMYPGNAGGSNWGGIAVDPERQIIVANVIDAGWAVRLIPRENYEMERAKGGEVSPQTGARFAMRRDLLLSPLGIPCVQPPWGTLNAIDMVTGEIIWKIPLGTTRDIAPVPIALNYGTPSLGGPLVTKSGLIFIAAAMDDYIRAFDTESSAELWKARLPAGGQAGAMTYVAKPGGRQYVILCAGGHGRAGTKLGDYVIAYALPE